MENVKIPISFVLEMDDVGWDDGRDLRLMGKASRSGLPRNHAVEDYEFIDRLSKRTGKSISVALCVADLDKNNVLHGKVGYTHDPQGWNRAAEIDHEKMQRCMDILENANVECLLHGILHGRYDENGKRINELEYMVAEKKADGTVERKLVSEEDLEERLDTFYEIYDALGLTKKIRGFVHPCGVFGASYETVATMARALYKRGIRYWANDFTFPEHTRPLQVIEGVACFNWGSGWSMPWEAYDCDPDTLPDFYREGNPKNSCLIGSHWTNYLRFNPQKNFEGLDGWERLYDRQSEKFGSMAAEDLASAVNQLFYHAFAKLEESENGLTVDLTEVDRQKLDCHKNEFFISFGKGISPFGIEGGEISLYEQKKEFDTYKITHTGTRVTILMK